MRDDGQGAAGAEGTVRFRVLGPTAAWDAAGTSVGLRGPRHRELLARLVAAHGRAVPVPTLVDDLWDDRPPPRAVGTVRTFVADLRVALEPGRRPRSPARVVVTEGDGYALRVPAAHVDAWRAEAAVAASARASAEQVVRTLAPVVADWAPDAYPDQAGRPWAGPERVRLAGLRALAVERLVDALAGTGRAEDAVALAGPHVDAHPWREEGWRLLALSLYRAGRQVDALDVLRRARAALHDELGLDPSPALASLEHDLLSHDPRVRQTDDVLRRVTDDSVRVLGPGSRARLETAVTVLGRLAVSAPAPAEPHEDLLAAARSAEAMGDPALTARVLGGFDVPSVWPRSDDPARSRQVAALAVRTLDALSDEAPPAARARLHVLVAVELRGLPGTTGRRHADEAVRLARGLGDAALLCSALGALAVHTCDRAGLAAERDRIGTEIVAVARRHDLPTSEVHGLLLRLQASGALGRTDDGDALALEIEQVSARHERPRAPLLVAAYRAMRAAQDGAPDAADRLSRAVQGLGDAGMPGVADGLLPLALLGLDLVRGRAEPLPADGWGPYDAWVHPLVLARAGDLPRARRELDGLADPPPGLLLESLWCVVAQAAIETGHDGAATRATEALAPADDEIAGAGSGTLTFGPVADWLERLETGSLGPAEHDRSGFEKRSCPAGS
ncbi:BTAD domain-containing putative transcriptional regulator [Cellulosimicrobium sp. Marseille-Q8652]